MVNSSRPWDLGVLHGVKVGDTMRMFASPYGHGTPVVVTVTRVAKRFIETDDGQRWLVSTGARTPSTGRWGEPVVKVSAAAEAAKTAAREKRNADDEVIRRCFYSHSAQHEWEDEDAAAVADLIRLITARIKQRTADDVRQKRKRT